MSNCQEVNVPRKKLPKVVEKENLVEDEELLQEIEEITEQPKVEKSNTVHDKQLLHENEEQMQIR